MQMTDRSDWGALPPESTGWDEAPLPDPEDDAPEPECVDPDDPANT